MSDTQTAHDPFFIKYIPSLGDIAPTEMSRILLSQLEYRFSLSNYRETGFWKFKEPCPNQYLYKEGDSWTEELGTTRKRFNAAFDRIGTRYHSKSAFLREDDPFHGKLYASYYDRISRRTYFFRNNPVVNKVLKSHNQPTQLFEQGRDHTETPSNVFDKFVSILLKETHQGIALPIRSKKLIQQTHAIFNGFFQASWDKVIEFCSQVYKNDWIMGRMSQTGFKAFFSYLIRKDVIQHILSFQKKPFGNGHTGRSNIQKKTPSKITKSEISHKTHPTKQQTNFVEQKSLNQLDKNRKEIFNEIVETFVEETEHILSKPKETVENISQALTVFDEEFEGSLEKIRGYFSQVARSKWLMGEVPGASFKATFMYVMKPHVIDDVHQKRIKLDRKSKRVLSQEHRIKGDEKQALTLKAQLSRLEKTFRQDHRLKIQSHLEKLDRHKEEVNFSAYLKEKDNYIYQQWLEKKWNMPYIDIYLMGYIEESYMNMSEENWVYQQIKDSNPALLSIFENFKTYVQKHFSCFSKNVNAFGWDTPFLDQCFLSFYQNSIKGAKCDYENA